MHHVLTKLLYIAVCNSRAMPDWLTQANRPQMCPNTREPSSRLYNDGIFIPADLHDITSCDSAQCRVTRLVQSCAYSLNQLAAAPALDNPITPSLLNELATILRSLFHDDGKYVVTHLLNNQEYISLYLSWHAHCSCIWPPPRCCGGGVFGVLCSSTLACVPSPFGVAPFRHYV